MDSQNNDKQGCGNTIFNINHVENLINGDVETLNNTHNEIGRASCRERV